jgi:hypothetical protein
MTAEDTTPEHIPLDWRQRPKPQLCEEVYDQLTIIDVPKSHGRLIRIDGQCPYCFGAFSYLHALKLVPSATIPTGQGESVIDVTIECQCAHSHPQAPDNVTGCGQHWTIEVGRR